MTIQLSPQQRRLWSHVQRAAAPHPFRAAGAFEIVGADSSVIEPALEEVVARTEILRVQYAASSCGSAVASVAPSPAVAWTAPIDLAGLPRARQHEKMRQLVEGAAHRDGSHASPLTATRVGLGDREGLIVYLPALSADTTTITLVGDALDRVLRGQPFSPISYRALAAWANALLESDQAPAAREVWRSAREAGHGVPLPFERSVADDVSFSPARLRDAVPGSLLAACSAWCARVQLPVEHVLLTAWAIVLGLRHRCDAPVRVSAWLDGRGHAELRGALGLLARPVPCVFALGADRSFHQVAEDAARHVAELAAWQDYSDGDRDNIAGAALEFAELKAGGHVCTLDAWAIVEPFTLSLLVRRSSGNLTLDLGYDQNQLTRADVERLAGGLCVLLEATAAQPDAPVATLPAVGKSERAVLAEWGTGPAVSLAEPALLHHAFEHHASRHPDRVAAEHGDHALTYGALDRHANGVANRLCALGVGANSVVAVFMERSLDQLAGVYGVLKSGAAYLPIDAEQPAERVAAMLADARAQAIVTTDQLAGELPSGGLPIVLVESTSPAAAPPAIDIDPDGAAYVIFTSGSTGRPKGVVISHRAITNQIAWIQSQWPLSGDDCMVVKAPIGFDASVWEMFWPLAAGARVVVADPDGHRDPVYLATLARDRAVTTMKFVPSMLAAFVSHLAEAGIPATLRRVLCGGEALAPETRSAFERTLGIDLLHFYGPSEAAIAVTGCALEAGDGRSFAPLGTPIANSRLYILDEHLERVPLGTPGELYIAGACLAQGYACDPRLTAERFVPDRFASGGARMYRTGDLVILHSDGALQYVGRADHQVKLRGNRIELGEIEAHLRRIPGVDRAAAAVVTDDVGERYLAGYVVADRAARDSVAIRNELRRWLPEPMVPSAIAFLDELPLTLNGKLDRKRLPVPPRDDGIRSGTAPETAFEQLVAAAWSEVLGFDVNSRDVSFFDVGGHSLLATQVVARIERASGARFTLHDMFAQPTIAGAAALLEMRPARDQAAPSIAPDCRQSGPLSYAQQRIYFLEQLTPGSCLFHVPIAMRIRGDVRLDALRDALDAVVERHPALRTVFEEGAEGAIQRIAPHRPLGLDVVELPNADDVAMREFLARLARIPFDLTSGPLVRPTVVRRAPGDCVLLLLLHHIAVDDWSLGVIVREIVAHYCGQAAPAAPGGVRYLDFARWERRWMESGAARDHLAYWCGQLRGLPPAGVLRVDPDADAQVAGAMIGVQVPAPQRSALEALGRSEGATLYMVLAAVLDALVHGITGAIDLVVGTPIANRAKLELESVVGLFSNACILRVDLGGDPTFREIIRRVREQALAAYTHQDLPFDAVVAELSRGTAESRAELFDVWFALQNAPMPPLRLAGEELSRFDLGTGTAKFPLALLLDDHGDGRLTGFFEHAPSRIGVSAAARIAAAWSELIERVLATPDATLAQLTAPIARQDRADSARHERRSLHAALSTLRRPSERRETGSREP